MVNATSSQTPIGHFVVLDSLRGLCALLVFVFHARLNGLAPHSAFVQGSWMFVDFFFVLSGFVIAANYRQPLIDHLSVKRFLWLRLGRIYPLHLFMLLVFLGVECLGLIPAVRSLAAREPFDAAHSLPALVSNLLLLQSFGIHGRLTWNQPAWSIATEYWTYVLFALAVTVFGARTERWIIVTVLACPLILWWATPYGINVTYDWGMVRCVYGFALGVLCWAGWQRFGVRAGGNAAAWTLVELFAVTGICAFVVSQSMYRTNLFGPPLFAGALLVFARAGGGVSRLLEHPVWLVLGAMSYSIYMVHTLVLSLVVAAAKIIARTGTMPVALSNLGYVTVIGATPVQQAVWLGVTLAAVIGLAWLTYTLVERPAQRWSRRIAPSIG